MQVRQMGPSIQVAQLGMYTEQIMHYFCTRAEIIKNVRELVLKTPPVTHAIHIGPSMQVAQLGM